jgi:hypothetical protein
MLMRRLPLTILGTAFLLAPARAPGASFTRGDCNADGSVARGRLCEVSDAIFLLAHLFQGGSAPPCLEACNTNGDDALDISDAVYLLAYCFLGGAVPPAPFPACGPDPAAALGCGAFPPCQEGCEAQDARGVGPCEALIGIFWDGFACRYHSGCSCEGADCGDGHGSLGDCYRRYFGCKSICEPMDIRPVGDPCRRPARYYWDGRACQGFHHCECEGEDCERLYDTQDACEAAVLGCPATCAPMRVAGAGPCDAVLGWYWDGFRCAEISGCECEGDDCARLFESAGACRIARQDCPPACAPMEVAGLGDCEVVLGHYWDGGDCRALSACECEGPDCARLTALDVCLAAHERCPEPCKPMHAAGAGACEAIRGYAWDGRQCLAIVGCECKGEDCGRLFESLAECRQVSAGCEPLCAPMDARGTGACRLLLGWAWDGGECRPLSGCECEGADCAGLFAAEEACQEAHRGCSE